MSPDERSEQRRGAGGAGKVRFLHRRWQALVFALLASALSLATYWIYPAWLADLDYRSRDVAFLLRDPVPPPPGVAVVAVDEPSIKEHGRWPWPRGVQARLITALKHAHPGVIALDIVYPQASQEGCECPDQDELLRAALGSDGAPVIGGYFFRANRTGTDDPRAHEQMYDNRIRQTLKRAGADLGPIESFPFVESSQADIAAGMAGLGFFNSSIDADGLVRLVPLVMRFESELYPSLALRAMAIHRGVEALVVVDSIGIESIRLGDTGIPVNQKGEMVARYYALDNGIPIYSAADVIAGRVGEAQLRDKLLFVGVTETGIADLRPTPIHPQFPGVAIHATAAANMIQGHYFYQNTETLLWDLLFIVLIPLVSIMLMANMEKLWHMGVALVFFFALLGTLFYYLVAYRAQLVSLIYPAATLVIAFAAYQIYFALTSQRTTRFLTSAFSSYVSPDVVERLLQTPDSLGLSGEEREVSVLFSDIRGFTTVSEQLEPRRLVDFLNEFFDQMTAIILSHQGTLDKFIGDAIMALFNAPLNIRDHQAQAARSALMMIRKLGEIRPDFERRYGVSLNIGVGLHCGRAVVGNLGSSQRFDYTAVGDAINLASRVESISKYYGVPIIHTAAIDAHLDESFLRRPLDRIRVKGKTEHAEIFQLMSPEANQQILAERFGAAMDDYFSMAFASAKGKLEDILLQFPNDQPTQIMLERCVEFLTNPPPGDWDGVYQAESK